MADFALALATPVTTIPVVSAVKGVAATGVTDPFASLMAAAIPAAPTVPAAKLPAAANADQAVPPEMADQPGDGRSAKDDDTTHDSDALLALLIVPASVPVTVPLALPVPIAPPAIAVPTIVPAALKPVATAIATPAPVIISRPPVPVAQSLTPAVPPIALAATIKPVTAADRVPAAPTTDPVQADDQAPVTPENPASQTSIRALVQMMTAQVNTAPAAPTQQPVIQGPTASGPPIVSGDPLPLAAEKDQAASAATPAGRTRRTLAPKFDRAAPAVVRTKAITEASAAKTEAARAEPQDRPAHPTAERVDDTVTPQPPLQGASVPARETTAAAKAVALGSVDAVVTRHLAVARDGQWLDSLAKDIAATGGTTSSLSFTLSPQHLGALKVDITQGSDGASVHMTTDTDATRTIILDAQPRLAAEARAQGLTLKETSVSTHSDPQRQAQSEAQQQASSQLGGQPGGQDRRAFAQPAQQPLSPTVSTAADEESDGDLYA